jgi:hypothetical protein
MSIKDVNHLPSGLFSICETALHQKINQPLQFAMSEKARMFRDNIFGKCSLEIPLKLNFFIL